MKRMNLNIITILAVFAMLMNFGYAQGFGGGNGIGDPGFYIDENGDGFNDNAPDVDGDGIPNGMDDDFVRPMDGSGNAFGKGAGNGQGGNGENGGYGPGDGTGGGRPGDGTGFGPGDCTAPEGVRSTPSNIKAINIG